MKNKFKVIIVGAGPSGVGVAKLLHDVGIEYLVLEKGIVGNSFSFWPKDMRMITPSFPSNAFGQMDLNSIAESSSPGFLFGKEHLLGIEYSAYLYNLQNHFNLSIREGVEIKNIQKDKNLWKIETCESDYFAEYVVWAAGEFSNPKIPDIEGKKHFVHSSVIKSPELLKSDEYVIVGGYESGVQLAYSLVTSGKKITLINPGPINNTKTSDPSKVLSPYTLEKYKTIQKNKNYKEIAGEVSGLKKIKEGYELNLGSRKVTTKNRPISATGFGLVVDPIKNLITYREDGLPRLKRTDEFFGQNNIYLCGPSVRHDGHIFCFIYKFRQRFGVVVEDILKKEKFDKKIISDFVKTRKKAGLYLKDLNSCADECVC